MKSRKAPPPSAWWHRLTRWFSPEAAAPTTDPTASALTRRNAGTGSKEQRLRRTARREHLYAAVRENMIRAGVLSSAYKFKVLTLDHDGLSHVVLIDLQHQALERLTEDEHTLEASLQKLAQERLGLEVRSVYWRTSGPMASPEHERGTRAAATAATTTPDRHETVGDDELQALHQALNTSGPWDRQRPEFEPTRPMPRPRDQGFAPLSDTQLGDLD